ncbi:MAG: ABC transporter ATP-binding protein [Actinomycetia bacterium]|nr:ABC transporter ATP-binding protein [Actinomycetes bacterium]MCP4958223.1 ABC transporter ATP-binding protein [Actinomycetes bacterium]
MQNLEVVYSDVILALRGVSLEVPSGTIVALLGANGAGKTTVLRSISGLLPTHRGEITKGAIRLDGDDVTNRTAASIVGHGLAQVMEGRRIFPDLSVQENLRAGAIVRRPGREELQASYEAMLELFPVLKDRWESAAGYLSGGEQQMVAIAQALMAKPKLLLMDEPSLGLAPLVIEQIRDAIVDINRQGTGVLLIEQNAQMALSIADHAYILENGKVAKAGPADQLRADKDIQEFYLGMGEGGRTRLNEVKSYRRQKQWSS